MIPIPFFTTRLLGNQLAAPFARELSCTKYQESETQGNSQTIACLCVGFQRHDARARASRGACVQRACPSVYVAWAFHVRTSCALARSWEAKIRGFRALEGRYLKFKTKKKYLNRFLDAHVSKPEKKRWENRSLVEFEETTSRFVYSQLIILRLCRDQSRILA